MNKENLADARELEKALTDVDCFDLLNLGYMTIGQVQRVGKVIKSATRIVFNIIRKTFRVEDYDNGWTLCETTFDSWRIDEYSIKFLKDDKMVGQIIFSLLEDY